MAQKNPNYSELKSLNTQWEDLSRSTSYVLNEHEGPTAIPEEHGSIRQQINTAHWANDEERTHCTDVECRKRFSLTERKHHCRRCGEVFCGKCTQYRRRLSVDATPNPDGVSYRVCKNCFDVGPQTFGAYCNKFSEFQAYRGRHVADKNNNHGEAPCKPSVNIEEELQRLVEGYKKCVGSSKIKNIMSEAFSVIKVPDWQKSKHWMPSSFVSCCCLCTKKFSVTETKPNCRICGAVVCGICSSDMLILYPSKSADSVQWALINIIGSPDEEPVGCLYLKICNSCHSQAAVIQGNSFTDGPAVTAILDEIHKVYNTLTQIQMKINALLPKYENLVDALEAKGDLKALLPAGDSATQTIAKYHLDLSDLFTQFAVDLQGVRRLKPRTNMQLKLAKNVTKRMFDFYGDNLPFFRDCKKRVVDILPQEVLEEVQTIVDQNAINNAYIYIKQLGLEALLLSDKHRFDNQLAISLADCENICLVDLKKQLETHGEDWDRHEKVLQEILQINLKEHRLIVPSRTLTRARGAQYVHTFLYLRCSLLVRKTLRQLNAKTTANTFSSSKEALASLSKELRASKSV